MFRRGRESIVHAGRLIVPYGFSDSGVAIARIALDDVLEALLEPAAQGRHLDR